MDAASSSDFENLITEVPCCRATVSLNDLDYEWPMGFARFVIEICNPCRELTVDEMHYIEELIGCKIKYIQAHI